jgi:hypothetical protein
MDLAEYTALDPETRRATWEGMSAEEQADLKAQKAAGGTGEAAGGPPAEQAPEAPAGASEAVNAVSQALGASVGRHLLKALTDAAAATGQTPDEVAARLMAGEDLADMGVEETATLKAAVNRLRGSGRKAAPPQVQVRAAPQAAQMPAQMPAAPQMQGMPQQQAPAADLISLLGGG